jgi:DNA-binding MarR family transcriptional regulator
MQDEELFATALEIRILAKLMTQIAGRSQEQHLQAHGAQISALQHGVMRLLWRQQYTSSELSRKMHLDPATMVPVIDALERHGYVQRGKDPADRRRTPLALTASGAALLARVPAFNRADALVDALARLGDERASELLRLLRELLGYMAADADLGGDLISIAQNACDAFRAQSEAARSAASTTPEDDTPDTPAE